MSKKVCVSSHTVQAYQITSIWKKETYQIFNLTFPFSLQAMTDDCQNSQSNNQ